MGCYKCGSELGNEAKLCPICTEEKLRQIKNITVHGTPEDSYTSQSWTDFLLSPGILPYGIVTTIVIGYLLYLLLFPSTFKLSHTVGPEGAHMTLSRSHSQFVFKNTGFVTADFRVFGFNPNPFGANNIDQYVESFGVGLMTTHILVVAGKDVAAQIYARDHCEQGVSGQLSMMPIIAKDQVINAKLNALAAQGGRVCVHLDGIGLEFESWNVDGKPQDKEIVSRMALQAGGANFGKPLLVDGVKQIECDS